MLGDSPKKNHSFKSFTKLMAPKKSSIVFISLLILAWYSSNIGVLLLNKYLLSNYHFKYPIFLTLCHMVACTLFSYFSIAILKLVPMQGIHSVRQFISIVFLSIIFSFSVVGGNISLRYIPVSFNQAIGATTPFFTAIFAYLATYKREAWLTYCSLFPVVAGIVLASGAEPNFHLYGFIICVSATACRALKSVVQGLLLKSEDEKLDSMNLLLYMAPISVSILIPMAFIIEPNVIEKALQFARGDSNFILMLTINSAMAYLVNLTNFLVTKHTSPLTLQVLGNAKGAIAVAVSIFLFQNAVSFLGMFGYSITLVGVICYGEVKRRFS